MLKYKVDKAAFEKLDNAVQALYKQDGDNYVLEVDGVKTVEDVENVQEALRKERDEHTKTKDTLKATEAERNTASDKVKVYESDDKKKLDSEQLVEFERLKRENETLTEANTTLKGDFEGLQGEVTTNTITAHLRKEAVDIMRDDAIENEIAGLAKDFVVVDGKVLTNSDLGDKSGLEAKAYLTSFVEGRSYLAPTSSGGGAGGGRGAGGGAHKDDDGGDPMLKEMQAVWSPTQN